MINELSIIIPTLNEAGYLPPLLDSISKQTFTGKLQVIVVDGRSLDNTSEIAKTFANRLPDLIVLTAKRDIGHQRNIGAGRAKYRYLLFLDADVILPPKLLAQISSKVNIAGPFVIGVMHRFQNMNFIDRIFFGIGCLFLVSFLATRKPVTNGDFLLTTRENYDNIKGFKEGAILGEDVDFGRRSVQAGAVFRFYFHPMVIGSLRRAHKMGRMRMLLKYIPAFLRIAKHGPIYPGQDRNDYPFGHYGSGSADSSSKSSRIS
ncbi:MAG TPA: glycosyltransferase [Candidatus Saccharimonadales bacterium]|nr:glycosyltransferase [Candidatus Saccharimonadales bacterium]